MTTDLSSTAVFENYPTAAAEANLSPSCRKKPE